MNISVILEWFPGVINEPVGFPQNNGWKSLVKLLAWVLLRTLEVLQPHSLGVTHKLVGIRLAETTDWQKQLWSVLNSSIPFSNGQRGLTTDMQLGYSQKLWWHIRISKTQSNNHSHFHTRQVKYLNTLWGLYYSGCMHAMHIFTRRMHELEDEEFEYDQKMEYIMKTHTYLKTNLCVISQSFAWMMVLYAPQGSYTKLRKGKLTGRWGTPVK